MDKIESYQDLKVWQRSIDLVTSIYQVTGKLPSMEQWGLVLQMRRAVVSIPSNIAEGFGRQSTGEYRRFICSARFVA